MCRMFGFRSVVQSAAHRSLVAADNALGDQSSEHPDGWGVAYYVDEAPHVTRSPLTALSDQLFQRVSGVVASETVVAHVRRATVGDVSVLNCHPFQHGRWVLAHNGDLVDFESHREELEAAITPGLRRYILGETDSERLLFLFLTFLERSGPLSRRHGIEDVFTALEATLAFVRKTCDGEGPMQQSKLTLLVTDGSAMAAVQGGKELYWSSYKSLCGDRENCPSLSSECEAPSTTGYVNHLLFSSEPLGGENIWLEMKPGEAIGLDWRMRLKRATLDSRAPLATV